MSDLMDFERLSRATRISTVEIAHQQLEAARAEVRDWQSALDQALWEAQRAGVEIRALGILIGYSPQAIHQAVNRAKRREGHENSNPVTR